MKKHELSRRRFLQSSALLGSAAALAGCSKDDGDSISYLQGEGSSQQLEEEKIVASVCRPNCFSACFLNAHVRNNRLVKTSRRPFPDPKYDRICLRGLSHAQRMYSPTRILRPLKRAGERGEGKWQEITWPEAIKYICDKFKEVRAAFGNKSVTLLTGSSNYATVQKAVLSKFFNLMGVTSVSPGLDMCEAIGFARAMGSQTSFPFNQSNEAADFSNAKTIITWGSNPVEAQIHNWHFIADAIDRGAKLISVDVMLSGTAARAHRVVHLNPGTDPLLALSLIQIAIEKDWLDYDFMEKNTVAPLLVNTATNRFVRYSELSAAEWALLPAPAGAHDTFVGHDGTNFILTHPDAALADKHVFSAYGTCKFTQADGVPAMLGTIPVKTAFQLLKEHVNASYKPADTTNLTGVDADVMTELVRIYTQEGPSTLIVGYAPDHYTNGHHAYHALATLAAITGNMGKKGASVGSFVGLGGGAITGGNISAVTGVTAGPSIPFPLLTSVFNVDNLAAPIENGKIGGPDELYAGVSNKMRAMYIAYSNPLNTFVNPQKLKKMFTAKEGGDYKLRLIALADYEITDTAEYADIILPLAHWFEQKDVCSASNHPYMTHQEVAVPALGESKTNSEIGILLAKEMGTGFAEHFNNTIEEYIDMVFDRNAYITWYRNMNGKDPDPEMIPTYARLKAEDTIRVFPGSMKDPYVYPPKRKKLTSGADDLSIGTSLAVSSGTGRIEFFSDFIWAVFNYGQATGSFYGLTSYFTAADLGGDLMKEQLPSWEPPMETVPGRTDYPLQLISERPRWRVHSQWHDTPWIREFDPYPIIKINPADAGAKGITTGSLVKVENDYGHCLVRAVLNPGIRKGTVNLPRGWHESQFREHYGADAGGSQRLTTDKFHKIVVGQCFYDVCVKITKVEG